MKALSLLLLCVSCCVAQTFTRSVQVQAGHGVRIAIVSPHRYRYDVRSTYPVRVFFIADAWFPLMKTPADLISHGGCGAEGTDLHISNTCSGTLKHSLIIIDERKPFSDAATVLLELYLFRKLPAEPLKRVTDMNAVTITATSF